MQNSDEVRERLVQILLKAGANLEIPTPINKQLNSIALVELILNLEKEFQFEISPLEYDPQVFSDLHRILIFLQKKKAG